MSSDLGEMTPAEAAHFVVETLLELVVAALLVTAAATLVVGLAVDGWPTTLTVATVALAVGTGVLWNRASTLRARADAGRSRAARRGA